MEGRLDYTAEMVIQERGLRARYDHNSRKGFKKYNVRTFDVPNLPEIIQYNITKNICVPA